jgi:hypothetical protein
MASLLENDKFIVAKVWVRCLLGCSSEGKKTCANVRGRQIAAYCRWICRLHLRGRNWYNGAACMQLLMSDSLMDVLPTTLRYTACTYQERTERALQCDVQAFND